MAVAVQAHIGHRHTHHAIALLDAVELAKGELIDPLVVAWFRLGPYHIERLRQEVRGAGERVENQVRHHGLNHVNDQVNDFQRRKVLSQACPQRRTQDAAPERPRPFTSMLDRLSQ